MYPSAVYLMVQILIIFPRNIHAQPQDNILKMCSRLAGGRLAGGRAAGENLQDVNAAFTFTEWDCNSVLSAASQTDAAITSSATMQEAPDPITTSFASLAQTTILYAVPGPLLYTFQSPTTALQTDTGIQTAVSQLSTTFHQNSKPTTSSPPSIMSHSASCVPYPFELINDLLSSLLSLEQAQSPTSVSSYAFESPQLTYSSTFDITADSISSTVTSAPTPIEIQELDRASASSFIQEQSSFTDDATQEFGSSNLLLKREPRSFIATISSYAPSTSTTNQGATITIISPTTTSKSSSAHRSKMPSISLLYTCVLLALLFVTPSLGEFISPSITTLGPSSTIPDASMIVSSLLSSVLGTSITTTMMSPYTTVSVAPNGPAFSRCKDNTNFFCVGAQTFGSIAGPPVAATATSTPASASPDTISSTASSSVALIPSGISTTRSTAASSSASYKTTDLSASLFVLTTTAPDSTVMSTTVITESQKPSPTLQSSAASAKRPPPIFWIITLLLAFCSTSLASFDLGLSTTEIGLVQAACTEDPKYGCVNGTPMSVVLSHDSVAKTHKNEVTALPTPCIKDPRDGCISGTPLSEFWSASRFASLPPFPTSIPNQPFTYTYTSGTDTVLAYSPTTTSTQSSLPTSLYIISSWPVYLPTPTLCPNGSKLCVGTTTVGPTPCVALEGKVCVGSVVVGTCATPHADDLVCAGLGCPVICPQSILTSGISSILHTSANSTRSQSTTPKPTITSPTMSVSTTTTSAITSSVQSGGVPNIQSPRIFKVLFPVLNLWPRSAHASSINPSPSLEPRPIDPPSGPTATATPCSYDKSYGCVGHVPVTDLAPPLAKPSPCLGQTTRSCLANVVLPTAPYQQPSTSKNGTNKTSTSTSTVKSTTSVPVTTVSASGTATPKSSASGLSEGAITGILLSVFHIFFFIEAALWFW